MTENALRAALETRRLDEGWGFDGLYADMIRVVAKDLDDVKKFPSTATLRRFVAGSVATRAIHLHFIKKYVLAIRAGKAA